MSDDLIDWDKAVLDVFRRCSETWKELSKSELTAIEEKALAMLVGSGLVERRLRFKLSMTAHPTKFSGEATVTGEYGLVEAMEFILRESWEEWESAVLESQNDEGERVAFHCQNVGPDEIRLTDQGVSAKQELDAGNYLVVTDFVLKRGCLFLRPPCRGYGRLISFNRSNDADVSPVDVNVNNSDELSAAIAIAMEGLLNKLNDGGLKNPPDDVGGDTAVWTKPMTQVEIANYFAVHRNHVKADVLAKFDHQQVGKKYRLKICDMPLEYHQKMGLTQK